MKIRILPGVSHIATLLLLVCNLTLKGQTPATPAWTTNWVQTLNEYNLNAVTWGNGLYVAVGAYGKIATSSDGVRWRTQRSGTIQELFGVSAGSVGGVQYYVTVGAAGTILQSSDGVTWTVVSSTPTTGDDFFAVGYGDGTFLAAGNNSFVRTSDMASWVRTQSPRSGIELRNTGQYGYVQAGTAVAYGNKQFVVSTALSHYSGRGFRSLWTSTDKGNSWIDNIQKNVTFYRYGAIAFGDGYGFLVAGHNSNPGDLCCAGSGQQFSDRDSRIVSFYSLDVFWSEAALVLNEGLWAHFSPDGVTWNEVSKPDPVNLFGATFGDDTFVCVGNNGSVRLTGDGNLWQKVATPTNRRLRGVTYGGGQFVAVGVDGVILTSQHGNAWELRTGTVVDGPNRYELHGVTEGPSGAMAVGSEGSMLRSKDGIKWTNIPGVTHTNLWDVYHALGRYVAVGDGGVILTSTDSDIWTPAESGVTESLSRVRFLNGRFATVGGSGRLLFSSDGVQWTKSDTGAAASLHDIAYGNGSYVAVGDGGTLIASKDGNSWRLISVGNIEQLFGVTYGGGMFLAVGNNGVTLASTDGESWRLRPSSGAVLRALDFADGLFLAVGDNAAMLVSPDGRKWTPVDRPLGGMPLFGVRFGSQSVMAVGGSVSIVRAARDGSSSSTGNFAITTQPTTQLVTLGGDATLVVEVTGGGPFTYQWLLNGLPVAGATQPTLTLSGIDLGKTGKYTVVVTGPGGFVTSAPASLVSEPELDLGIYAGLTLKGTVGQTYTIEYTPDIKNDALWKPLDQVTLTNSVQFWLDFGSLGSAKRFYRATPVF
ncbi:MAG: hypothetical protein EXS30_10020 [Pedosphaera sp.]|nr:hypothetical protein [Pedosphaera sp.]